MYDKPAVQHIRESIEQWEKTDVQSAAPASPNAMTPLPPSPARL